ncbi:hypothetical protein A3F66_00375 [candidate division TM6 bacterium RIFCSPHIGHO2_12_FULL_32_22]|nr:MAG: hypothetical protein A3F66_00375 [candidate division TM6 bacterium RIFCSPHIGHO2_12_FULL_32_22]
MKKINLFIFLISINSFSQEFLKDIEDIFHRHKKKVEHKKEDKRDHKKEEKQRDQPATNETEKELREITDELSQVVEELQEISKIEKELLELRKQEAERVEQAAKLKEKIEIKEEPKKPICEGKCGEQKRDCEAKRDQSNLMVNCEGQYCSCINKCPGSHDKC